MRRTGHRAGMAREGVVTSSVTDVVKWGILKEIAQRPV